MTATEELRRMLDERGVEYYASPNGVSWGKLATPIHGRMYTHYAVELDGLLCVDSHCITPEQAIAATLEDETCFPALSSERDGMPYLDPWWVCSECGCQLTESRLGRIWQNYCPNCGRRIRIRRAAGE